MELARKPVRPTTGIPTSVPIFLRGAGASRRHRRWPSGLLVALLVVGTLVASLASGPFVDLRNPSSSADGSRSTADLRVSSAVREPYTWPFSRDSIWNLPIGADAVYVNATTTRATSMAMHVDPNVIILKPNAPNTSVYFNDDGWSTVPGRCDAEGGVLFSAPIPANFRVNGSGWPGNPHGVKPNYATAILQSDNHTLIQGQPFARCFDPVTQTLMAPTMLWSDKSNGWPQEDLYGRGNSGAHGGSRLSSIGGAVRLGELVPGGVIRHAMKVALDGHTNLYRYNATDNPTSFRWPATTQDGCWKTCYGGSNPAVEMGSLLALKRTFDVAALESGPGKILAQAFQDYGAYVSDDAFWSVYGIMTELSPDRDVIDEFNDTWNFPMNVAANADTPWSRDLHTIFGALHVIDNWNEALYNTVAASNGTLGAGGGAPWVAWAPDFGQSPTSSFTFGIAGDYGFSQDAKDVMTDMGNNGLDFALALGDLTYQETNPANWCNFFESKVGDGKAILIVGNHDVHLINGTPEIDLLRQNCNFGIDADPTGDYAKEFYFDYPQTGPLARFIMTGCGSLWPLSFCNTTTNPHYTFVSNAIDGARAANIPWVIVGMHMVCITAGTKDCEIGTVFQDLLLSKRVDLVLQGHDHTYQRSKQLTCATKDLYRPECVVDSDGSYAKGAGTVISIVGTGGRPLYGIDNSKPDSSYFAVKHGNGNNGNSKGFLKFTATATSISAGFVKHSGSLQDSYTVEGSGSETTTLSFQKGDGGAYSETDDSFIYNGLPNNNYGTNHSLFVDGSGCIAGGTICRTLLMFPNFTGSNSGQVPADATIVSATLQLTIFDASSGLQHLHQVNETWTEAGVTWNSFATDGSPGTKGPAIPFNAPVGTVSIDVTAIVQNWVDGVDSNLGVFVQSNSTDGADYRSSEYGTIANRPKLTVTFQSPFDFTLSVAPSSGMTPQGGSTQATVTANLTSGEPTSVSFSASGLPSGATAMFSPSSCVPTCTSTMTIGTQSSTPAGTYPITISGTGGELQRTTTYSLVVTAGNTTLSFQKGDGGSYSETDDAHIRSEFPNNNYGTFHKLYVDGGGCQGGNATTVCKSLIKFPEFLGPNAGQVPEGSTIVSATLQLTITNAGGTNLLYQVTEFWSEGSVTWNSFAIPGSPGMTGSEISYLTSMGTITVDITGIVQNWVDGNANDGVLLRSTLTSGVSYNSSENANNRPKLTVTFSTSSGLGGQAVSTSSPSPPENPVAAPSGPVDSGTVTVSFQKGDGGAYSETDAVPTFRSEARTRDGP